MEQKTVTLEEAFNMALAHMEQKNYRVAELVLQDILTAEPGHTSSHYMLGIAQYYMGNIESAIGHLEVAVQDDEPEVEWWCNYGILLTELGRYGEAIVAYDKAIATDADYAETYWNKSHALWLAGLYAEAEKAARHGLDVRPDSPEALLNLGTALVKLDRKDEAVECWEKALEINPDFVFAWSNLGNVYRDMGQLETAVEKCRKALELDPKYPQAMNNLANALMDMGDEKESEEFYRKAITLMPEYVEAHNNLSINLLKQSRYQESMQQARIALSYRKDYLDALLSLSSGCRAIGELEEAEKAIQQAVLLKPDSAEVRINLADLLFMQDRYGDAEVELERARILEPDTPRLYIKLAEVLDRGNKTKEALEAVDKAIELSPEMPEGYMRKGVICHTANYIEEAQECFDKVLDMRPDSANAVLALADLCLSTGDVDKAEEYIERAKVLSPNIPALFYTLGKIKKYTEKDPDFQAMLELEKSAEKLGFENASTLNFAVFNAYEQIGDSEKAFEHLLKANACKRKIVPYDAQQQNEHFDAVQKKFTVEALKALEGNGCESDLPVFIVGMPRSGTTLTEQIISSHKDVFGAGELIAISLLDSQFGGLDATNAKEQGQWYIDQAKQRDKGGKALRITDKMPGNFSAIGKIVTILPNAKIIHTRRNPIDTCLSCFKQGFARGQYWSYDLKELGEYYNKYLDLMAYWRDILGDKFIEIDYEQTVEDLEPQARMLIDHVGLPWDDACLEPHKQKRAVLTASKQQVTKPIYKTSVKSWKKYEKQLAPLIDELMSGPAAALLDD